MALAKMFPQALCYGSDQDSEMLARAKERIRTSLPAQSGQFSFSKANFSENPFVQEGPFDLIALDLGISSLHVDLFERGLSYRRDEKLDMRLDPEKGVPLYRWLQNAKQSELIEILQKYGEERRAPAIARMIVKQVAEGGEMTSGELAKICERAYPPSVRYGSKRHSAARTFQAFRIFINREIEHLKEALEFLPGLLSVGGRLAIISFHSLEDRAVKQTFSSLEKVPTNDPLAKSVYREGDFKRITRKPVVPDEKEMQLNPRARSAKLRVLERTAGALA